MTEVKPTTQTQPQKHKTTYAASANMAKTVHATGSTSHQTTTNSFDRGKELQAGLNGNQLDGKYDQVELGTVKRVTNSFNGNQQFDLVQTKSMNNSGNNVQDNDYTVAKGSTSEKGYSSTGQEIKDNPAYNKPEQAGPFIGMKEGDHAKLKSVAMKLGGNNMNNIFTNGKQQTSNGPLTAETTDNTTRAEAVAEHKDILDDLETMYNKIGSGNVTDAKQKAEDAAKEGKTADDAKQAALKEFMKNFYDYDETTGQFKMKDGKLQQKDLTGKNPKELMEMASNAEKAWHELAGKLDINNADQREFLTNGLAAIGSLYDVAEGDENKNNTAVAGEGNGTASTSSGLQRVQDAGSYRQGDQSGRGTSAATGGADGSREIKGDQKSDNKETDSTSEEDGATEKSLDAQNADVKAQNRQTVQKSIENAKNKEEALNLLNKANENGLLAKTDYVELEEIINNKFKEQNA